MCTVLLRFRPGESWPLLMAAVRDEFVEREWDPPAAHWNGPAAGLLGGRDRTVGGTWMAVDPDPARPAVAALLNGVRRPLPDGPPRPTRGTLVLDALGRGQLPEPAMIKDHDGFHLLLATPTRAEVWSWNGEDLAHQTLTAGDHIVVNLGIDAAQDPLIPHFAPLLEALPDPDLSSDLPPGEAWEPWTDLLRGDGLADDDPRALVVRRELEGRHYGTTSASLVALSPGALRYDFNADPRNPSAWYEVAALGDAPARTATA
jgi:hypothetical protein